MANQLWSWSDGVATHRGYETKEQAVEAARDAIIQMNGVCNDYTHHYTLNRYVAEVNPIGYVGRYSLPSNGADSQFETMQSTQRDTNRRRAARDKADIKQLRRHYICDSCGATPNGPITPSSSASPRLNI